MPIIKSAKKAARQAEKRTLNNQEIKKAIKAALKELKTNPVVESLSKLQSEYDKAVKKGLMKQNTASRRKAAAARYAKKASAKPAATKPATTKKAPAKTATKTATKSTTAKKTPAKKTAK